MKNFLIIPVLAFVFTSCNTARLSSYSDDVYNSPSEELRLAKIAAAEKAKKEEAEKQKAEQERLARKAKDDANPNYKDPQYNADDYYDYKYASQIHRFNNPIPGAGYYDNYYTNSYSYNHNPGMYGTSIYSSYNYLMPSGQFNNYSNGINVGYNPYGYNSGFNNCQTYGYNSYGYNSYGYNNGYSGYGNNSCGCNNYGYNSYGYNNGYGYSPNGYSSGYSNGYSSLWGYFNGFDVNSSYSKMTYGARGSNGGGNSTRNTSVGMQIPEELRTGARQQFIQSVAENQQAATRFTQYVRKSNPVTEAGNANAGNSYNTASEGPRNNGGNNLNGNTNLNTNSNNNPRPVKGFWPSLLGGNVATNSEEQVKTDGPRATNKNQSNAVPVENTNNNTPVNAGRSSGSNTNSNSTWNGGGNTGGSSGGSSPRGGGSSGGGGGRHR